MRHYYLLLLSAILAIGSCSDDVDTSNLYSFKGETITSYLSQQEDCSSFYYLLTRVKLSSKSNASVSQLLSARGNYTVFVPTNEAVQAYVDSTHLTTNFDIHQISDSAAASIVCNAIIDNEMNKAYETTDFQSGALERTNLQDRYITIDYRNNPVTGKAETLVNSKSIIFKSDIETTNGFVHYVDHVVEVSLATLPALIAQTPNLQIFSKLLETTGWADSMLAYRDENYENETRRDLPPSLTGLAVRAPEHRYTGYTAFVETDSLFTNKWNIPEPITQNGILQNWEEILPAIIAKCKEAYPNATSTDLKSRENAVNQFISYHLLPERITYDRLVIHYAEMGYNFKNSNAYSINCFEYYETMSTNLRRLIKLTEGATTRGKRINRHSYYDKTDFTELNVTRPGILIQENNKEYTNSALNGFYYPIDDILIYDNDVPNVVLNERIRFDISSLLPELMTNGYRRVSQNYELYIPHSYFSTLKMSEECEYRYLPYYNATVPNYQGDEHNIKGQYDFTLKLPPVPFEGTYEIRWGAPSNSSFGMAQLYLGTDPNNLTAIGLPLDLRVPPSDPGIGWEEDTEDELHNIANDKAMRNHGYMKPPQHDGVTVSGGGPVTESMRRTTRYKVQQRLRKIIYTGTLKPTDVLYIRVKSVLENTATNFLLDIVEYAPKHIYNGSEPEDIW